MAKHISLEGTELALGLLELVEDGVAEIVKHHQDPKVANGKSSVITLTITVTPSDRRDKNSIKMGRAMKLAVRDTASFDGTLYARMVGDDVEVSEYDPKQMRMPFDRADRTAA